jgi:hypothetical protein
MRLNNWSIAASYDAVSRLFAFENAVDVAGREPELIEPIRPVGYQAVTDDEEAVVINRRQLVLGR